MAKFSCIRVLALFGLLISCSAIANPEALDLVDSDVFQTSGSSQEITKKAKLCMIQILHNDEVRIADSSSGTGFLSFAAPGKGNHSSGITGGPVLVDADIEAGTITANSRVDYSSNMISRNVKSTVIFQAKDGKFKIKHTAIEYLMKDTGNAHNSGYMPVMKVWGTGWADVENTLKDVTEKLATCIKTSQNENW